MIEKRYLIKEIRNVEDRTITGTAIVFNSLSEDLGGFREIIDPQAVTQEFIDTQDIVMLYNHDDTNGVLARSKYGKGSLKVNVTDEGVDFSFNAKNTSLGNEVLEAVRSGDLDACSFAFICKRDTIERNEGQLLRTIKEFDSIHDLSIVIHPAYTATEVDTRSIKTFEETEAMAEQEKNKELEEYFRFYDEMFNKLIS